MTVAVNLSARQFHQQNLVQLVGQILAETGCDGAQLELEITESVVMADPAGATATATLQELNDMGVSLSIDDFGTGHSSLSYLKRFPIHALEIDRSFVRDLTTDAAIVRAVIALAHTMLRKVIAEGVETEEQLNFLREHRGDSSRAISSAARERGAAAQGDGERGFASGTRIAVGLSRQSSWWKPRDRRLLELPPQAGTSASSPCRSSA